MFVPIILILVLSVSTVILYKRLAPRSKAPLVLDKDIETLKRAVTIAPNEPWGVIKDTPELKAYKTPPHNSPELGLKGGVFIPNTTLSVTFEHLWNICFRSSWDPLLSTVRIVEKTSNCKDILYFTVNSSLPFVVPHREFILQRQYQQVEDTIYIVCKSARTGKLPAHEQKPKDQHVRAKVPYSGYIISPKDSGIWVDFFFECDLKGTISPSMLHNMASLKVVDWLEKLRDTCRGRKYIH